MTRPRVLHCLLRNSTSKLSRSYLTTTFGSTAGRDHSNRPLMSLGIWWSNRALQLTQIGLSGRRWMLWIEVLWTVLFHTWWPLSHPETSWCEPEWTSLSRFFKGKQKQKIFGRKVQPSFLCLVPSPSESSNALGNPREHSGVSVADSGVAVYPPLYAISRGQGWKLHHLI